MSSSGDSQSYQLLLYNVQQDLCWQLLYFATVKKIGKFTYFSQYEMKVCSNEGLTHETSAFNLTVTVWRVNSFYIHFF